MTSQLTPSAPKSIRNRWGVRLAIGARVTYSLPRGGNANARIVSIERTGSFARAYGPRVTMDDGRTASPDDCRILLERSAETGPFARISI